MILTALFFETAQNMLLRRQRASMGV